VRLLTMAPALAAVWLSVRPVTLLVLSQAILSMQLPFSIIPLVSFTSNRKLMGSFANPPLTKVLAWAAAVLITALNLLLLAFTVLGA